MPFCVRVHTFTSRIVYFYQIC